MIQTAELVDFRQEGQWYLFQYTAEREDVFRVEEIIKLTVLSSRRVYEPRSNTWRLKVDPSTDRLLTELFVNGRECVEAVGAARPTVS